jgi:hypothetical protein
MVADFNEVARKIMDAFTSYEHELNDADLLAASEAPISDYSYVRDVLMDETLVLVGLEDEDGGYTYKKLKPLGQTGKETHGQIKSEKSPAGQHVWSPKAVSFPMPPREPSSK